MTLAFIADYFGDDVASEIQLNAEYYSSSKVYGVSSAKPAVSNYIKKLK